MKVITVLLLVFFTSNISSQNNFKKSVEKCYNQKEFNNIGYRLEHEKECFVGLEFPDFIIEDANGSFIARDQLKGKITIINFWFVACAPCIAEIPGLNLIYNEFKGDNFLFIAATTDDTETVKEYFEDRDIDLKFNIVPNSLDWFRNELGFKSGFPTTIIIDRKGIIRDMFSGGRTDHRAIEDIYNRIKLSIETILEDDK